MRFGRDDHKDLSRLPSASAHKKRSIVSRSAALMHGLSKAILIVFAAALVMLGALAAVLATTGISNTHFTALAQTSLNKLTGEGLISEIKDARLSLDGEGNLAFDAQHVRLSRQKDNTELTNINSVQMGMKALPLLFGTIEITRLEIDGVSIKIAGDANNGAAFLNHFKGEDGLYAPRLMPALVHNFVNLLRQQLEATNVNKISVSQVNFVSTTNKSVVLPIIDRLNITKKDKSVFLATADVSHAAKNYQLSSQINKDDFGFSINGLQYGAPTVSQLDGFENDAFKPIKINAEANFSLKGKILKGVPVLLLELNVARLDYRNSKGARVLGDCILLAEIVQNIDKIEFLPSRLNVGTNTGLFTGAIGPAAQNDGKDPHYRFEFLSNDTHLSPLDSPEKKLLAEVSITGIANPETYEIEFSQIGVRTPSGELLGRGNIIVGNSSPEMIFSFDIPKIDIADAKHLWPSVFAGAARKWVLNRVYGGTLTNSTINIAYRAGSLWPRPAATPLPLPTADQVAADFTINNARFDVIGDLPPVREANGVVSVRGAETIIKVSDGKAYFDGKTVTVSKGAMTIPVKLGQPIIASLDIDISGKAADIAEVADKKPINALAKAPIQAHELSGSAVAHIVAAFPLRKADRDNTIWKADVEFNALSIDKEFDGQKLSEANGSLTVTKNLATFTASGNLNGLPAKLKVIEPLGTSTEVRHVSAKLRLDDKARLKIAPALNTILRGPIEVEFDGTKERKVVNADISKATLNLGFAGWSKGAGIPAKASFEMSTSKDVTTIKNLEVSGKSFSIFGELDVARGRLRRANFSKISLNKGDDIALSIESEKNGFELLVSGSSMDMRALLKKVHESFDTAAAATGGVPISLKADLKSVTGFNNEKLQKFVASYSGKGSVIRSFTASANSENGGNIALENRSAANKRTVQIQTSDGGALLRFMNIYDKMQGGTVNVNLSSRDDGPLIGEVDARRFTIVDEPRLKSLVGSPVHPDGTSLVKLTKNKLEVSRVKFERGNALIEKGKGYLKLNRGILRSEQIGLSYSGTLYDVQGSMNMTGTFMPAFGLNRIFSELPLFGELLGNGRDKGLIGITFRLAGSAKAPDLTVNPVSLIAPGFLRQIFEFE